MTLLSLFSGSTLPLYENVCSNITTTISWFSFLTVVTALLTVFVGGNVIHTQRYRFSSWRRPQQIRSNNPQPHQPRDTNHSDTTIINTRGEQHHENHLNRHPIPNQPRELSRDQIETIASRNWKSVLAWITFHPDELRWGVDRKHQTALHHACLFRAPTHILDMMLYQAPELAHVRNEDGEIALHWAVRVGAPNQVMDVLLAAHPTSGVLARDKQGNTPLSLLWERHQEQLEIIDLDNTMQHRTEWKRLEILMRYYHNHVTTSATSISTAPGVVTVAADTLPSFRPLHLVACCPCPPALFRLIYRCYSDTINEPDEQGRLPLTCACLDASSNLWTSGAAPPAAANDATLSHHHYHSNNSSAPNNKYEDLTFSKIQFLVTVDPSAARVRDYQNRLALFWALESGITWDQGVSELVAAFPKSVVMRDPKTKLFPFQLATAAAQFSELQHQKLRDENNSPKCSQMGESTGMLYTAFRLLRCDPGQQIAKYK